MSSTRASSSRGESVRRVKGTVLHVPVVHGSHAVWQGPRGSETRTHRWWLYLRPLYNADISHFIKHVEFVLHESFDPPMRKVSEMPYEISEYGWGEFDAVIRVVFRDPSEKSVEFFHPLKLFPSDTTELSKRPVVHEFYDEIVFQDPNERLLRLLKSTPHGTGFRLKASILAPYYKDFTGCESADLKKIEDARKKIREETIKKQARFEELEAEREILMREISARGGDNV